MRPKWIQILVNVNDDNSRIHVLCHIINVSVHTGGFPDCLKLAWVTPIPKGRDSTNAGNNRQILVRPIFNKKLEKVVNKETTLIENKIIYFISINMVSENISLLYEALLKPTEQQSEQMCHSVAARFQWIIHYLT